MRCSSAGISMFCDPRGKVANGSFSFPLLPGTPHPETHRCTNLFGTKILYDSCSGVDKLQIFIPKLLNDTLYPMLQGSVIGVTIPVIYLPRLRMGRSIFAI